MEPKNYRKRIIDDIVARYLCAFGAILLEGPKWCGKTWTGKHNSESEFALADPSMNFNNRRLAVLNPDMILDGALPRLIDEWQEVPAIWDAVRGRVDENPEKGQFILTGSASIDKSAYIHTGTGRIARLRMRPMSLYELGKSDGKISLSDICEGKAEDMMTGEVTLESIIEEILIGGWPSALGASVEDGMLIASEYVKAVLNEDIYKVDSIKRDRHKVELVLRSLARNEATTASNNVIKRDIKDKDIDDVNIDSVNGYLDLLSRLYLTENIPPFAGKLRSSLRVKQSDKRHFVDPSLPCALLGLSKEKLLGDLELLGFLFESLADRDLLTYVEAFGAKLYHYQDYKGNEIDAVIELRDGSWCGFEVKLGAHQIDAAAANLIKTNEAIVESGGQAAKSLCVICALTNAAYRREDGVYVVPLTSLRP